MFARYKNIFRLLVVTGFLTQTLFSQTFWDNGSMSFNYGTYVPSSDWSVNGSIIPSGISEGAGGFITTSNDTSTLVTIGYRMSAIDSNLVADAFIVVVTDTGSINPVSYTVNPIASLSTIFLWLPDLNGDFLMEVISGNISLDSLTSLNIRIALTGTITVNQVSTTELSLGFQGVMIDASTAETFVIANGAVTLGNSLPTPDYVAGAVTFDFNGTSFDGTGNFNPLLDAAGSGGVTTQNGDTLNYSLMSYQSQGPDAFDVFGITIRTLETLTSGTVEIVQPGTQTTYPQAQSFYIRNASLADLYLLLQNPSIETLDSLNTTEMYIGTTGEVTFTRSEFAWDGTFNSQMGAMGPLPVIIPLENGEFHLTLEPYVGIEDEIVKNPSTFELGMNYPNPFNPATTIPFFLSESGNIRMEIFDLAGHSIETLYAGMASAGWHSISWNPRAVASGIYLVRLTQGSKLATRKLMYLK